MHLRRLLSRFKSHLTVFRHSPHAVRSPNGIAPPGETWTLADAGNIDSLFAADPALRKHFRQFLDAQCIGAFLLRDGQWASYGWISTPGNWVPPHLPRWVGQLGGYWFFHGHTREDFRGQGCFRRLLERRIAVVREREAGATIYVDTEVGNFASRRALQSVGFRSCGVLFTYKLWIPRIGSRVLYGSWLRNQPHPAVPGARLADPGAV